MLGALIRRRGRLLAAVAAILAVLVGAAVVAFGRSADVVVYNGRSQYGDETVFTAWEDETGKSLELRAGSAPELFERLRSEGSETPADLLVTTDLANLWRAKEAGVPESVSPPAPDRQARRGRHGEAPALLDGQRAPHPRLRRRRAGSHSGRPLRRRPHQPLLP